MSAPSARGLFRATGKKSKPVAVRLDDGSYVKVPHRERQEDDFERTPPEATRAFMYAEAHRLMDFDCLWEPAAGDGAISSILETEGFDVFKSDLVDRGCGAMISSFYQFAVTGPSSAIVTNPPFQECSWGNARARWIGYALDALNVEYMALLLPITWATAAGMRAFYQSHKPARVYQITWRLDFTGMGAQPASHAWWVWDKSHVGEPILRLLYRSDDGRQSNLFAEVAA